MYKRTGSIRMFWSIFTANKDLALTKRFSRAYDKMVLFKEHTDRQLM